MRENISTPGFQESNEIIVHIASRLWAELTGCYCYLQGGLPPLKSYWPLLYCCLMAKIRCCNICVPSNRTSTLHPFDKRCLTCSLFQSQCTYYDAVLSTNYQHVLLHCRGNTSSHYSYKYDMISISTC